MTEATPAFKHVDVVVSALLLKLMTKLYPECSRNQLIGRFWRKETDGKQVFTLPSNPDVKVISLADTILIKANEIDLKKNPFLDKEYFDKINDEVEIRNITGKYKKVWEMQNGKCYICRKEIRKYQEKSIIFKELNNDTTYRNMAYIHSYCQQSEIEYIKCEENVKSKSINELIEDIEHYEKRREKDGKSRKFDKLTTYFHNVRRMKVVLNFFDIEKIIGSKLCKSAYQYKSYFYNNQDSNSICNSWISQGYRISKIDMENKKIYFEKDTINKARVMLPEFLFDRKLPTEARTEIEHYFKKVKDKYNI